MANPNLLTAQGLFNLLATKVVVRAATGPLYPEGKNNPQRRTKVRILLLSAWLRAVARPSLRAINYEAIDPAPKWGGFGKIEITELLPDAGRDENAFLHACDELIKLWSEGWERPWAQMRGAVACQEQPFGSGVEIPTTNLQLLQHYSRLLTLLAQVNLAAPSGQRYSKETELERFQEFIQKQNGEWRRIVSV